MRSSNQTETKSKVVLYTDGSCAPTNPGPGGWAYLPVVDGVPDELVKGSEARSTNNRMELTAAIEALKTRADGESVELFTDSEYLRLGITQWMDAWLRNGWTRKKGRPVLNKDLWLALHTQNTRLRVEWRWVKAHAGHTFNEMVDQAARDAAMSASRFDIARTEVEENSSTTTSVTPRVSFFITTANVGARRSAWAFLREEKGNEDITHGIEDGVSSNRALLAGVIELLQTLRENDTVRVTTDSEYLFKGATQWLESWRQRGWRKSDDKPVANKDLWIEIHALLDHGTIDWQFERRSGHNASVSALEAAGRAARDALELLDP